MKRSRWDCALRIIKKAFLMATFVADAFSAAGLTKDCVVKRGVKPSEKGPGVYVVSLTYSLDGFNGILKRAPRARCVFQKWLKVCPELTLNDTKPDVDQLMDRVGRLWLPDEVILYIGKAASLSKRLND